MSNNYSHSIRCERCSSQVLPRIQTVQNGKEQITEAKYVCPRCGTYCRREVVERKSLT